MVLKKGLINIAFFRMKIKKVIKKKESTAELTFIVNKKSKSFIDKIKNVAKAKIPKNISMIKAHFCIFKTSYSLSREDENIKINIGVNMILIMSLI